MNWTGEHCAFIVETSFKNVFSKQPHCSYQFVTTYAIICTFGKYKVVINYLLYLAFIKLPNMSDYFGPLCILKVPKILQ